MKKLIFFFILILCISSVTAWKPLTIIDASADESPEFRGGMLAPDMLITLASVKNYSDNLTDEDALMRGKKALSFLEDSDFGRGYAYRLLLEKQEYSYISSKIGVRKTTY